MAKKTTNPQQAANRRDYSKNKDARKRSAYHRQARLFIRSYADESDIKEMYQLLEQRQIELKKGKKKEAPSI